MPRKEKTKEEKARLRKKIIESANRIAADEGWSAVTMRRISSAIGYSLPIIYKYFDSKENLVFEIASIGYAILVQELEKIIKITNKTTVLFQKMAEKYVEFSEKYKSHYQAMYGLDGVVYFKGERPLHSDKLFELFYTNLLRLQQEKKINIEITPDSSFVLWSTFHGIITLNYINRIKGDRKTLKRLTEQAINYYIIAWKIVD